MKSIVLIENVIYIGVYLIHPIHFLIASYNFDKYSEKRIIEYSEQIIHKMEQIRNAQWYYLTGDETVEYLMQVVNIRKDRFHSMT